MMAEMCVINKPHDQITSLITVHTVHTLIGHRKTITVLFNFNYSPLQLNTISNSSKHAANVYTWECC